MQASQSSIKVKQCFQLKCHLHHEQKQQIYLTLQILISFNFNRHLL